MTRRVVVDDLAKVAFVVVLATTPAALEVLKLALWITAFPASDDKLAWVADLVLWFVHSPPILSLELETSVRVAHMPCVCQPELELNALIVVPRLSAARHRAGSTAGVVASRPFS